MCEFFRKIAKRLKRFSQVEICRGRSKGVKRTKKYNILSIIILALVVGLFFSVLFEQNVLAKKEINCAKNEAWQLDPLEKIGKSFLHDAIEGREICQAVKPAIEKPVVKSAEEEKYAKLVEGHPIVAMVPAISKKDKKVAAFLIGIAKKESDWGKYSPQKNGRTCHNYWGYKGGYNPTESGYSCFDSPEQAVEVVGNRLAELIGKKIDTPQKMVVWKCGSSCAGHDPVGVKKWISDVSLYYDKLNS
jgi:hypothetical protein